MVNKRSYIWISLAVISSIALIALVTGPLWIPYVFAGTPRNQNIDSRVVECKLAVGMTKQQVISLLGLPKNTMTACVRPVEGGGSEVEIVGSSPPWRDLRPGYHTIVLRFDKQGCVVGGCGIWWAVPESDTDALQLRPTPSRRLSSP